MTDSQPSSSSEITEAKKLADRAKDVLARGYIDLEGFVKGVVELSAALSSLKDSQLTPEEAGLVYDYLRGIVSPQWENSRISGTIFGKLHALRALSTKGTAP